MSSNPESRSSRPYDVVIVGARAAGAATAMLLARHGLRVLVVERSHPGSDTLSTHALMRGGVMQLHRWGLLDRIVEAGTPAVRRTTFSYGPEQVVISIKPAHGVDALYAPAAHLARSRPRRRGEGRGRGGPVRHDGARAAARRLRRGRRRRGPRRLRRSLHRSRADGHRGRRPPLDGRPPGRRRGGTTRHRRDLRPLRLLVGRRERRLRVDVQRAARRSASSRPTGARCACSPRRNPTTSGGADTQ